MAFISIAGNIGAGKTTLANIIGQELGFNVAEEKIDTEILQKFYEDIKNNVKPSETAFLLQMYFLFNRGASHLNIQSSDKDWVQERIVYEDKEVFARHLHNLGFISDARFQEYNENFEICARHLRLPDLLIYLRANISTLRERIRKRARPSETTLLDPNNPYLEQLQKLYDEMIDHYPGKILVINTDYYDLEQRLNQERAIELIKLSLNQEFPIHEQDKYKI
jgi:deoxyadenosine/deoxycytidine kinase